MLTLVELRENQLAREMAEVIDLPPHDPIDWHKDAVCGQDEYWGTDLWFSEVKTNMEGKKAPTTITPTEAQAADLCWTCPVRTQCLKYATDTKQMHGTWGGLPIAMIKEEEHDLFKLLQKKNPFDTEDVDSKYHRSNLRKGAGRPRNRKAA